MLLKELCMLPGLTGYEAPVRDFIRSRLDEVGIACRVDRLGNIIAENPGPADRKLMLTADMDEVSMIVTGIESSGWLKFGITGHLDPSVLDSCDVLIENSVSGVIGVKPIHALKREERGKPVPADALLIDIGARSREEAEARVQIGAKVTFAPRFRQLGCLVSGKAVDARAGCSVLLDLLLKKPPIGFTAVFSVIGRLDGKGLKVGVNQVQPDAVVQIKAAECADLDTVKPERQAAVLGDGPCFFMKDGGTVYDIALARRARRAAESEGIRTQLYRYCKTENYDIHYAMLARPGADWLVMGVPCRYTESPVAALSLEDYRESVRLAEMLTRFLTKEEA